MENTKEEIQKLNIELLSFEITRKCTKECSHCMLGDSQPVDLKKEYVDKILERTLYIGSLLLTGGEPMCNPKLLIYIMDEIMRREIYITGFEMTTNGDIFVPEVYFKMIEFYNYCGDKNMCGVMVSRDKYHEVINEQHYEYWSALEFYRKDREKDEITLIDTGKAQENSIGEVAPSYEEGLDYEVCKYTNNITVNSEFLMNALGYIVNYEGTSYVEQEKLRLFHIMNINEYFNSVKKKGGA